ncbi:MAG: formate dehydrogenase accessory sulfurtransferase FdhD [bacterium]|nr:formate dehydrogenase accessory sulfurtransferase FdhD [bacterium]
MVTEQHTSRRVVKIGREARGVDDDVAVEEPLEMRLAGETVATTMRTPGHDALLAQGFFYSEGFVERREQIGRVSHCGRAGTPEYGNVIDLLPAPGILVNFEGSGWTRRGTLINSACGVCGRNQIDDLLLRCQPFPSFAPIDDEDVPGYTRSLSENQPLFQRTGGVHAAAAFDSHGAMVACYEDVGRHNATDKVIGRLLETDSLGSISVLVVSGRVSFEIVQKATTARIPALVAISAPTSLAIDLALAMKMTLIGFARGEKFTRYTG